jgi:hypothetical protein
MPARRRTKVPKQRLIILGFSLFRRIFLIRSAWFDRHDVRFALN